MPTLDWIGKKAVVEHHRKVPYRLLQFDKMLSAGDPNAAHLLVQGDNLLALQALRPFYAGRVKCIYIDPPYNTGNEGWVYNDNVSSPEIRRWLGEVVGKEAEDLTRHDKWLCMMYPRLALLRDFLADDGVIFISIDDNELSNLLFICDELFGRARRIAVFTWVRKKKGSNLSKQFRKVTEYVLAYRRGDQPVELFGFPAYAEKLVPLLNRDNNVATLKFQAGTVRVGRGVPDGEWPPQKFKDGELAVTLHEPAKVREGVVVSDFSVTGRWRWSQATVNEELANGSVFTASKDFRINVARYNQADKFKPPSSLLSPDDGIGTNEDATEELRAIFPEYEAIPFDYPKPTALVSFLIRAACKSSPNAIVMDSFLGSGTTLHASLLLNANENMNLQCVGIELNDTVCRDITATRVRRVIEGYGDKPGLGGGFAFCKLGEPLFDELGNVLEHVRFCDLAACVFFSETGVPLPKRATGKTPLLGSHQGRAIYLLYNGVLGDRRPVGGNVLTHAVAQGLPLHPDGVGPRIVFGEACRLGNKALAAYGIEFRQIPFEMKLV